MEKQNHELVPLRKKAKGYEIQIDELKKQLEEWKKKYKKSQDELRQTRIEKNKLKQEIEKLTITNNRYSVALFDHGNFKHPDAGKKKKGGQTGHKDTNRERHEDYKRYPRQRLFLNECGHCGNKLSRVSSVRSKILLDIVIHPEIVKLILDSERQWCGSCKVEVYARDNRTLPFTEYGINTLMMCLILRFKAHASMENIATVITISHGLTISKSNVASLLKQAKDYLKTRYEELKKTVREGQVIYADETGWLINKQKAWMWIICNEDTTVYYAAESRGKGIAEDLYATSQAHCMHDGLRSYENTIPQNKQCYCWSHVLRFAHEETIKSKKGSRSIFLKNELVRIYHLKKDNPEWTKEKLAKELNTELDGLLAMKSRTQAFNHIQARLWVQKKGLINSLLYTSDGTNNLAERELRPMVINKKISNGSNTFAGMETSAIIGSVVQTVSKKERNIIPKITDHIKEGVTEKYLQYLHTSYYDA